MGVDERMSWMEKLREDARKENCRRVIIGAGHEKSMSDNVKPVMVGERDVSGYVAPDEANFVPPSPRPKFNRREGSENRDVIILPKAETDDRSDDGNAYTRPNNALSPSTRRHVSLPLGKDRASPYR